MLSRSYEDVRKGSDVKGKGKGEKGKGRARASAELGFS